MLAILFAVLTAAGTFLNYRVAHDYHNQKSFFLSGFHAAGAVFLGMLTLVLIGYIFQTMR